MENIENQDSLNLEEEVNDSEIVEEEETPGELDGLSDEEKTAKLEETNKKLFARAKKAEVELKALKQTPPKEVDKPQPQPKVEEKDLDKLLDQKLEERELNSLDISDELKTQIKTYAKVGGLTVKQTLQSEYFKYLKQQEEAKQKVEEAAIGGKRRAPSRQEFDVEKPPEVDMSTEEGRTTWENYLKFLQK